MRKAICLILACVMSICFAACTEEPTVDSNAVFHVGFGKEDITPDYPVHLGGYPNVETRISEGTVDKIYAIAVAMTDTFGKTVVLITADIYMATNTVVSEVREAVSEHTGIPEDCIIVSGTHNHSAPDYSYNSPNNYQFKTKLIDGIVSATKQALLDGAPTEISIGSAQTEGLSFVRRYNLANGEITSTNYNEEHGSTIVSHESEADPQMQIVRFVRENRKDIVLVNWQSFVGKQGNNNYISPDFIGPLRNKVEQQLDVHCIYYEGAAGNLSFSDLITGNGNSTGWQQAVTYGELAADFVISALNNDDAFEQIRTGEISVKQTKFIAQQTLAEVNFVSVGELSFLSLPMELFDSLGVMIKQETPFKMTVLMGYTNGIGQYLPSQLGFSNGGYEAVHTSFRSGEGEEFVQFCLKNLNDLQLASTP